MKKFILWWFWEYLLGCIIFITLPCWLAPAYTPYWLFLTFPVGGLIIYHSQRRGGLLKGPKTLIFHWYWDFTYPCIRFFRKPYKEWWGKIRAGFFGVNIYWEVPRADNYRRQRQYERLLEQ